MGSLQVHCSLSGCACFVLASVFRHMGSCSLSFHKKEKLKASLMRKKRKGGTYASISLHDIILHVHPAFWHIYTVDYRKQTNIKNKNNQGNIIIHSPIIIQVVTTPYHSLLQRKEISQSRTWYKVYVCHKAHISKNYIDTGIRKKSNQFRTCMVAKG